MRQSYEQRQHTTTTPSKRKTEKKKRIKTLLKVLRTDEPTPIDEELRKLLEEKASGK